MNFSPPFFRLMLAGSLLAFSASWFYLTRELFLIGHRLWPRAWAGEPAAILLVGLALPLAVYLAQSLFYLPRRPGPAVFIRPGRPWLAFLPLPFGSAAEGGPAFDFLCPGPDREELLLEAGRPRPLAVRLALLLQAQSPLDRLLRGLISRRWPLVSPLARLLSLLLSPARQFMRCWGYLFYRLGRSGDGGGPLSQLAAYKRAVAHDLAFRVGDAASGEELRRAWRRLARVYDHPDYGFELGRDEAPPIEDAEDQAEDRPWLKPRYRGLYLDLPVTWAAATVEELSDGGPEEDPAAFYPPELGREVELTARLEAERRRLSDLLPEAWAAGPLWLDGRLVPPGELEALIWDLEEDLWRQRQRLAAHHRRCRGSHLAAAVRRGDGWPELLRDGLARLFAAERQDRVERRHKTLADLLAVEEALDRPDAEKPELAWIEPEPAGPAGPAPLQPPAPRPRAYSEAARMGLGFGRNLLALVVLGLLIWQGAAADRSRLFIHNGLDRDLIVSVDLVRLNLPPFGRAEIPLWPGHEYQITAKTADGQLVESFRQRPGPRPGREVYNVAGAAPLMEWTSGPSAGRGGAEPRFLGRPRWLTVEADILFQDIDRPEDDKVRLVISGHGSEPPEAILAAFENQADQDELIRLHARWDRPDSLWFWSWQALLTEQPDWIPTLLERLEREPDFLEAALWDRP